MGRVGAATWSDVWRHAGRERCREPKRIVAMAVSGELPKRVITKLDGRLS
jgi:hypothetical protein